MPRRCLNNGVKSLKDMYLANIWTTAMGVQPHFTFPYKIFSYLYHICGRSTQGLSMFALPTCYTGASDEACSGVQ